MPSAFPRSGAKGNKVVFGTSFGYMNQMVKVAKAFPNTVFMHATGYKTGANLGVYDVRTYEGAYMLGVVAGKMSKGNKLGVVASIPIRKSSATSATPSPWARAASTRHHHPRHLGERLV